MDVVPPIRTAGRDFYLAYLNSPDWRRTRNRALSRAGYSCSKCGAKRDLQVHHKTYERLGRELDSDLEVLCFDCHRGYHLEQSQQTTAGIYLKLVREAVRGNELASIADIAEEVNLLCAEHRIPNDPYAIDRAINLVLGSRTSTKSKPYVSVVEVPADEPLSHAQAKEFLIRLGMPVLTKTMPAVQMQSQREADCQKALEMIAREMQASIERCETLERDL